MSDAPEDMAPRHVLAAALAPLLPPEWRIVPYQRTIGAYTKPFVMLKQESITPHPSAPRSVHAVKFTVTIATAHTDVEKAEDDLDDNLVLLLHKFDALGLLWGTAEKKTFDDQHLCYDIDVTLATQKQKDTP